MITELTLSRTLTLTLSLTLHMQHGRYAQHTGSVFRTARPAAARVTGTSARHTFQTVRGAQQVAVKRGVKAEERHGRRAQCQCLVQPWVVVQAQVLFEPDLRTGHAAGFYTTVVYQYEHLHTRMRNNAGREEIGACQICSTQ